MGQMTFSISLINYSNFEHLYWTFIGQQMIRYF